jgi:hypothetical protein
MTALKLTPTSRSHTELREVGTTLREVLDLNRPPILEVPNHFLHPGYGAFGQWK